MMMETCRSRESKNGVVVKESMRNERRIYETNAFAFIGVRLERGNSFTLRKAVVIGPRVR